MVTVHVPIIICHFYQLPVSQNHTLVATVNAGKCEFVVKISKICLFWFRSYGCVAK